MRRGGLLRASAFVVWIGLFGCGGSPCPEPGAVIDSRGLDQALDAIAKCTPEDARRRLQSLAESLPRGGKGESTDFDLRVLTERMVARGWVNHVQHMVQAWLEQEPVREDLGRRVIQVLTRIDQRSGVAPTLIKLAHAYPQRLDVAAFRGDEGMRYLLDVASRTEATAERRIAAIWALGQHASSAVVEELAGLVDDESVTLANAGVIGSPSQNTVGFAAERAIERIRRREARNRAD